MALRLHVSSMSGYIKYELSKFVKQKNIWLENVCCKFLVPCQFYQLFSLQYDHKVHAQIKYTFL